MTPSTPDPVPRSLSALLPDGASLLLSGVVGSTAYGLDHAGSDRDRLGVFLAEPRSLMGLTAPAETVVAHDPDIALHELRKLLALGLRCNPTVTELLWLDSYEVCTPLGERVVELRSALLSEPLVRSAYLGYAQAQLKKLQAKEQAGQPGPRAQKHARHMFRLLEQGTTLLTTGELRVRVADPEWYLSALPLMTSAEMEEVFAARAAVLDEARSALPVAADTAAAEALLVEARIAAAARLVD